MLTLCSNVLCCLNILSCVRRKIVVAKQNYRCAGCGTRIDPGTSSKMFKHQIPNVYCTLTESQFWFKCHFSKYKAYLTSHMLFSFICTNAVQQNFLFPNMVFLTNCILLVLFCLLSPPQTTSSVCATVNTSAATFASAATRTPRRWFPGEC